MRISYVNLTTEEINAIEADVKSYIFKAIEVEKAGLEVNFKKNWEPLSIELENKFKDDHTLKNAFETLPSRRQRGYVLYFSSPKQSKTRTAKIEKCMSKILNGEGLNYKYNRRK